MRSDPNNSVGDFEADEPRLDGDGLRVCRTCNTPLTADAAGEFCAVCMLRSAIGEGADTGGEASFESSAESGFGHYQVEECD